jgi:hypothetical protein
MEFKQYASKGFAEARSLTDGEGLQELRNAGISVTTEYAIAFDSLQARMVFRNPVNHADQWYVARAFFDKNYDSTPA